MKNSFLFVGIFLLLVAAGCKKNNELPGGLCNLPSSTVPGELVGNWASGYNSRTQILDTYNGAYLGNAYQSGKFFHFEQNGKNAEFFLMINAGLYASTATRALGTVEFLDDESFIFHACKAHYKGWQNGSLTVDRDATNEEVSTLLTRKFYYSMVTSGDTEYMQIKFDPNDEYGTSFRQVP